MPARDAKKIKNKKEICCMKFYEQFENELSSEQEEEKFLRFFQDILDNTPRVPTKLNLERYAQMEACARALETLFDEQSTMSEIKLPTDTRFGSGAVVFTFLNGTFAITDEAAWHKAVSIADNWDITAKTNGTIELGLGFNKMFLPANDGKEVK